MNNDLISQKAQTKNINKIKASSAEIVVHGTKEKPYYEIKYFDLSDNEMHIGYSSYNLDNVLGWLEEYFEISEVGGKSEKEILKRRLNEAEYNRDFCIKQLIVAAEQVDKYKEELKKMESE